MTRPSVGHMATGRARGGTRGRRRGAAVQPANCDAVWAFIREAMRDSAGRSPSVRQIATGTGLSLRIVQRTLGALEDRRLIEFAGFGQARGIRIVGARYELPDATAGNGDPEREMAEHGAAYRATETR